MNNKNENFIELKEWKNLCNETFKQRHSIAKKSS